MLHSYITLRHISSLNVPLRHIVNQDLRKGDPWKFPGRTGGMVRAGSGGPGRLGVGDIPNFSHQDVP